MNRRAGEREREKMCSSALLLLEEQKRLSKKAWRRKKKSQGGGWQIPGCTCDDGHPMYRQIVRIGAGRRHRWTRGAETKAAVRHRRRQRRRRVRNRAKSRAALRAAARVRRVIYEKKIWNKEATPFRSRPSQPANGRQNVIKWEEISCSLAAPLLCALRSLFSIEFPRCECAG